MTPTGQKVSSSSSSSSRHRSATTVTTRSTTMPPSLMICFIIAFVGSGLVVVIDAVGPKYIQSNQPTQSTRSKQQQQQKHPWTTQRSVIGSSSGTLQPPTTRHFLDQCVSFLDVLEVIALRGGGGGGNSRASNANGNGNYDNDPSPTADDWSSVNNHPHYQHDNNNNNMDDDDEYYYGGTSSVPQKRKNTRKDGIGNTLSSLPNMLQKVDRKTGLMLLVSGFSVTFLGITLFFNKTIIRLGHLLCIAGVLLSMGLSQTIQYFVQPEKLRATICLGIGVFLVFIGSPLFGIALEVFGILNLFGNMFPIVMIMIKQMPIVGTMLKSNTTNNSRSNDKNRSRNNENDDYYYSNDSRRQPSSRQQNDYDNRDEYAREEDEGLGRRY